MLTTLPRPKTRRAAKADERDTCLEMTEHAQIARRGQILIADKSCRRAASETQLNTAGIALTRPAAKTEPPKPGRQFLRPLRQTIEPVNHTLKSQLSLERHRGRTRPSVTARVLQHIHAHTAATWHNQTTQQPGPARTLIAYDH